MEIDFIQRFGFGRVPDSAFQDILVDACAVTKAGVGMAGGVGRIGGKLPGKLRFALTIFVVRIRLDADFLQERIELAVTPVLFVPETAFSIGKERTVFHRGGIRMFKNRNAKVENGNDAVASGLGLAAADQISTGFRAVKIFVFEVQQLIDTHSAGQKSNYHLPGGRVLLAQDQRHLFVRENLAFRRFASFDFQDRCKVGIHDTPANGCAIQLTDKSTLFFQHTLRQAVIGHLIKDVLEVLRIEGGNFEVPQWTKIFPRNVIELASLIGPALIFTGLFEHPEAVLQGRVLIGCGRTLHHFGADSFCFFTGDVGANSLHDCNSGVRIRDRHSEQPWFPACSGHSCDAAIARRGFQPGRFSFGWNGRWSYCTGGWRCANGMTAGRAEFSGI